MSSLVSVGTPLRDTAVTANGADDIGELLVRSPSLASGYVNEPGATAKRFRDGSLRTGDLGFVAEGQLYVAGRADDIIVVAGQNVDAVRLERALAAHPELRGGNATVVARHEDGRPNLVAYVEPRNSKVQPDRLADELADAARTVMALPIEEWVFLRRGRLPKTPSGKTQRFRLRQQPPDDEDVLARVASR
jgi:fatty-acyl-CoA synthase